MVKILGKKSTRVVIQIPVMVPNEVMYFKDTSPKKIISTLSINAEKAISATLKELCAIVARRTETEAEKNGKKPPEEASE